MSENIFVADLEADGFLDVATQVWCGAFISLDGKIKKSFSPLDGKDYVKKMLEFMSSTEGLIFHNGFGYDFPLLEKLYGFKYTGKRIDTLVLSRLYNPNRRSPPHCPNKKSPHSIEAWGYRVGRGKPEHNDWSQFSPEMLHRCEEDVEIGLLTYKALLKEEAEYDWSHATRLTTKLFDNLARQERYGWTLDIPWALKSVSMLEHWMARLRKVLEGTLPFTCEILTKNDAGYVKTPFVKSGEYHHHTLTWLESQGLSTDRKDKAVVGPYQRVCIRRLSLDKRDEMVNYLLEQGWIPAVWNTNDKGERTSPKLDKDDPFEGVEGGVGRLLAKYNQCKSRLGIVKGYLDRVRPDGRLPSIVSGLAETARAKHQGIANVPNGEAFFGKWMRKCFIAKEGWKLVGTDSAGCQNRMLAARVGDPAFTRILIEGRKEDGTSIHQVNQKALLKYGFEVSYGKAKALNYAFMFGASDNKLGRMVGGGKAEGGKVREALLSVSPGFLRLVESLKAEWRSNAKKRINKWRKVEYYNGWVKGLDGRPIFIASEHAILVYVLQSDEAIMMSVAYCLFADALEKKYTWGEDYGIVCWYHDEYTVECKPELTEEISRIAEQCIVRAGEYLKISCPHAGEAGVGDNWYDIH